MGRDKGGLWALTGIAFFVVVIISIAVTGAEPPGADEPVTEIVEHYVDKKDSLMVSAFLGGLATALLVLFAAYLREVLRAASGGNDFLPTAAFAGLLTIAIAGAIDSTITLAIAETAEDIEPGSVQALHALFENDYIPFAVGSAVFLIALAASVLSTGVLPKWIGWLAVVLAVINFTPFGFVSFIGAAVLVAVISVMLAMRGRQAPPAAGAPGA